MKTSTLLLAVAAVFTSQQTMAQNFVDPLIEKLDGVCKDDVAMCDTFPTKACATSVADLCDSCFDGLVDGEKPSKACIIDCALNKRDVIFGEKCTAEAEAPAVGRAVQLPARTARMSNCAPAGGECKDVCANGQRRTPECLECIEEHEDDDTNARAEGCAPINPFKTCKKKMHELCGDCQKLPESFDDDARRLDGLFDEETIEVLIENKLLTRSSCMEQCSEMHSEELEESCKRGTYGSSGAQRSVNGKVILERIAANSLETDECKDAVLEQCGTCMDNESGLPTKTCLRECMSNAKDVLKAAGCRSRVHANPRSTVEHRGKLVRIALCFAANFDSLSPACAESLGVNTPEAVPMTFDRAVTQVDHYIATGEEPVDVTGAGSVPGTVALVAGVSAGAVIAVAGVAALARKRQAANQASAAGETTVAVPTAAMASMSEEQFNTLVRKETETMLKASKETGQIPTEFL